jgi:ATPase subunit of ABC transporter with duplicated ATPase domains
MLLLDEPTNHLDAESVAWLERFLEEYQSTVIAVTHDRYFLDNVAGWILELDRGHGIPWEGNYSSWLEQKEQRLKLEEATEKARRKAMQAELEWVRANPKGRQAKSKARLKQFEEISSSAYQKRNETNEIYIPPGPRLGDLVIEATNVSKASSPTPEPSAWVTVCRSPASTSPAKVSMTTRRSGKKFRADRT